MLQFKRISTAKSALNVIFGAVLWLCLTPSLIIIVPLIVLLRWTNVILAKIFRPDLIHSWGFEDSILGLRPFRSNGNTCQIWKVSKKLDVVKLRTHFYRLFLSTPQLQKKYHNLYCTLAQWGLYIFKKRILEKNFDLTKQIREYEGPQFQSELELDAFISKYNNEFTKPSDQPLWGIIVIYMEKTDESVLIFSLDHGLTDGYSFVNIISKLSGCQAPYLVKDNPSSFTRKVKIFLSLPKFLMDLTISLICTKQMPFPNYTKSIHSSENEWMISYGALDLETIKKIRRATGTHFNTVLGAIQIGAMRRYCLSKLAENSKPNNNINCSDLKLKLPEECFLISPTGRNNHPHPAMTDIDGGMTNHLTLSFMKFPMKFEDSPFQRLIKGEESFLYQEDAGFPEMLHNPIFKLLWGSIPSKIFVLVTKLLGDIDIVRVLSQVMSPLMLSSQKHKLLGHEVKNIYLPVQTPASFPSVHVFLIPVSHSGQLDISINATKRIFKDQLELDMFTKHYLNDELDDLASIVFDKQRDII